MKASFAAAAASAFRSGAESAGDPRAAKRIILANQISLSIAALSLCFVFVYLVSGDVTMAWLEIPISLGYLSVHRFNRAGHTRFARLFLVTLANLDVLTYTLVLGTATEQHLAFLAAGWAPLVLFDWEERKSIVYGIALSSLALLATEWLAPPRGLRGVVPSDGPWMRLAQVSTMQFVQVLLLVYFFRGNRRTEMALALATGTAQSADVAKGRFLARMSRSIRAPLEKIGGLSARLLDSGLPPERRLTAEDIRMSARDLLGIVNGLLDMSRIEAGTMELAAVAFSPSALGRAVLRPFGIDAGRKGVSLAFEADPALPEELWGDEARLKQILRNLIGNACKFTDRGSIVLRMRYAPPAPGNPAELICEVEDTGIGVPEEARAGLFEPFAQAEPSAARQRGGTGLGLYITRQIVESMGGTIAYQAKPGGGSIFRFGVPVPEREAAGLPDAARPGRGP